MIVHHCQHKPNGQTSGKPSLGKFKTLFLAGCASLALLSSCASQKSGGEVVIPPSKSDNCRICLDHPVTLTNMRILQVGSLAIATDDSLHLERAVYAAKTIDSLNSILPEEKKVRLFIAMRNFQDSCLESQISSMVYEEGKIYARLPLPQDSARIRCSIYHEMAHACYESMLDSSQRQLIEKAYLSSMRLAGLPPYSDLPPSGRGEKSPLMRAVDESSYVQGVSAGYGHPYDCGEEYFCSLSTVLRLYPQEFFLALRRREMKKYSQKLLQDARLVVLVWEGAMPFPQAVYEKLGLREGEGR
ncbi:MAG: hypothetical protein N3E51_04670 [Candidatus Micrarchaeota archaeon]|nr:hypothetical protein [Candidatus Micrarchaeota archaeon]